MTVIVITSGATFLVPLDWSATNLIEVTGGASGGSSDNFTSTVSSGGGGSAYISIQNLTGLTPGSTVNIRIGAGGAGETASAAATPGGDSWFNGTTLASSSVGAKGGSIATGSATGGAGGLASACIPASGFLTRSNGGNGGLGNASGSGAGGGGAGGSSGAGGNGGAAAAGTGNGGAGGAGNAGSGGAGGLGGTVGAGGAGGANQLGGGGGGGAKGTSGASTGGAGGLPGGGGGGGSTNGSASLGGAGAGGQIVITYTPSGGATTVPPMQWDSPTSLRRAVQDTNYLNVANPSSSPLFLFRQWDRSYGTLFTVQDEVGGSPDIVPVPPTIYYLPTQWETPLRTKFLYDAPFIGFINTTIVPTGIRNILWDNPYYTKRISPDFVQPLPTSNKPFGSMMLDSTYSNRRTAPDFVQTLSTSNKPFGSMMWQSQSRPQNVPDSTCDIPLVVRLFNLMPWTTVLKHMIPVPDNSCTIQVHSVPPFPVRQTIWEHTTRSHLVNSVHNSTLFVPKNVPKQVPYCVHPEYVPSTSIPIERTAPITTSTERVASNDFSTEIVPPDC